MSGSLTRHRITIGRCIGACALAVAAGVATTVGAAALPAQSGADAATHKQWMNDASDAQEDFRFAVNDKDAKLAADALGRLESLMASTRTYWAARKAADGVRLAEAARTLAAGALTAAKSGNLPAAGEAFEKLGATCNSCHELHLEKR